MSTSVHSLSYTRTQSIVFMVDTMRNVLREVIRESGISPGKLVDDWDAIGRGMRVWMEDGHLQKVVIEFFPAGSSAVSARWDFPITYTGSGVDDDMWLDKSYLRQIISKAARPSTSDSYRVMLVVSEGARDVPGFATKPFLSTANLSSYSAGTVIATSHLTAHASYWRSPC